MLKSIVSRTIRKLQFASSSLNLSSRRRPTTCLTTICIQLQSSNFRCSSSLSKTTLCSSCCTNESNNSSVDDAASSKLVERVVVDTDVYSAVELALDSVVKIFTVASSPNYSLPWQNKSQRESTGSG